MSTSLVTPITVTRELATVCDPRVALHVKFSDGLADSSCGDPKGAPTDTTEPLVGALSEEGFTAPINVSGSGFGNQGIYWEDPEFLSLLTTTRDVTIEVIATVQDVVQVSAALPTPPPFTFFFIGQSSAVSNNLLAVVYDRQNQEVYVNLAFVGSSDRVAVAYGEPIHLVIQKPAAVSAGTPERYWINGVLAMSQSGRHTVGATDTILIGGTSGSSPTTWVSNVTWRGIRVTNELRYPTDGSSFTPPTDLAPPGLLTSIGDPVVSVGAPYLPSESSAGVYTTGEANPWAWAGKPVPASTQGTASGLAPTVQPSQVTWTINYPPYYGGGAVEPVVEFDDTSWTLTSQNDGQYRKLALTAAGTFIPRASYVDGGYSGEASENGSLTLSAQAVTSCEGVEGFDPRGFSSIGGHLTLPTSPGCPAPVPLTTRSADTVVAAPDVAAPRDFSYLFGIGKTPDQFTFTIESVGDLPLTVGGVEWHGWYFNNTRRI